MRRPREIASDLEAAQIELRPSELAQLRGIVHAGDGPRLERAIHATVDAGGASWDWAGGELAARFGDLGPLFSPSARRPVEELNRRRDDGRLPRHVVRLQRPGLRLGLEAVRRHRWLAETPDVGGGPLGGAGRIRDDGTGGLRMAVAGPVETPDGGERQVSVTPGAPVPQRIECERTAGGAHRHEVRAPRAESGPRHAARHQATPAVSRRACATRCAWRPLALE